MPSTPSKLPTKAVEKEEVVASNVASSAAVTSSRSLPYGIGGVGADPNVYNDPIPKRFIDGVLGDMTEARRRWQVTKKWRVDDHVDNVLEEPQPNFALVKHHYPHGIHEMSKEGYLMYYERPGKTKMGWFWEQGLSLDDLARHYVFITEYLWRVIDPREDGMLVSIFDVGGAAITEMAGNTLKLFKMCNEIIGTHYPERCFKMFVINAPWWFKTGFSIVSPFIDPRTKKKIVILGTNYKSGLLQYFDEEAIPPEFGGTSKYRLGKSPAEVSMMEHVKKINTEHNVPFDTGFKIVNVREKVMGQPPSSAPSGIPKASSGTAAEEIAILAVAASIEQQQKEGVQNLEEVNHENAMNE